jgi:hypothetical protein
MRRRCLPPCRPGQQDMPRPPPGPPTSQLKYAAMLGAKLEQHGTQAWLVNTGWTGGRWAAAAQARPAPCSHAAQQCMDLLQALRSKSPASVPAGHAQVWRGAAHGAGAHESHRRRHPVWWAAAAACGLIHGAARPRAAALPAQLPSLPLPAGELDAAPCQLLPVFNLRVPLACPGVPRELLLPSRTWEDGGAYQQQLRLLAGMFVANFKKFQASAQGRGVASGLSVRGMRARRKGCRQLASMPWPPPPCRATRGT